MSLTLLLMALLTGLLCAPFWAPPSWWVIIPLGTAVSGLIPKLGKLRPLLLLIALVTTAPLLYWNDLTPRETPGDLRLLDDGEFYILSGELVRQHQGESNRSRLDLKNLNLHTDNSLIPMRGRLRLTVDQLEAHFLPGDTLQFRSRIKRPRTFGTPGEFNYPRYLASRGIYSTGFLNNGRNLVHRRDLDQDSMLRPVFKFRQETSKWLQTHLEEEQALLLNALILGERSAFPEPLRERISKAGLAHLLAISGLHLGLFGWFLYQLSLTLYRRSTRLMLWQPPARIIPLLLIPFLGAYTVMTGSAMATCRAFFMFSIAAILLTRGQRQRPVHLLQIVVLLLLLANPLTLWDAGLQLSVAGVSGILLLVPRWQKALPGGHPTVRKILEIPLATIAATATTAPLVALHFHQFIPAGLVSNLVAIPLIGFGALPIGILACLGNLCSMPGSGQLVQLSGWLISQALSFGEMVASLDLLAAKPWFPDPWQLGGTVLVLLALLLLSHGKWKRAALCMALSPLLFIPIQQSSLRITALAVGQGEAILAELPGGVNMLIDGGGLRSPTFDVGKQIVAPALGRLGIHQLDSVILTHAHPDHYRGLAYILAKMPVKNFVTALSKEQLPAEIRQALRPETRYVQLRTGWQQYPAAKNSSLFIWAPLQNGNRTNDRSLAVHLGHGQDGVLLTGDLETSGVQELSRTIPPLPVSLLKLPHHGSRHSSTEILLDSLKPKLALVSAGFNNSYHLPSRQIIEACNKREVPLLRTDLQGSIRLTSDGQGWRYKVSKAGLFH